MTNLVIDVGNSFIKIAVFNGDKLLHLERTGDLSSLDLQVFVEKYNVNNIIISSVRKNLSFDIPSIPSITTHFFSYQLNNGIKNLYKTPETLGLDRLAAVIGAKKMFPNSDVLVVDAGTCITFDYVDKDSVYKGGSISPGIEMRFKALNFYTGKLPLVDFNRNFTDFYGEDTLGAILSGVLNGISFEVEGYIKHFDTENNNLKIILCGGDAEFFDTRLKNSIFAHQTILEPNLVSIGLNTVVNIQDDKN